MPSAVFDLLKFFDGLGLKAAYAPENRPRHAVRLAQDASRMKELATKGGLQNVRIELKETPTSCTRTNISHLYVQSYDRLMPVPCLAWVCLHGLAQGDIFVWLFPK